jgi:hypothetical protein
MKIPTQLPAGAILAPILLTLLATSSSAQARERERAAPSATPATIPSSAPDASGLFAPLGIAFDAPVASVLYDEPGDGRLWALGASWKASFGAEGVVYYPRVGADEPRRLPHALSPESVTIGGQPVAFERSAHATRDGDRVEIRRGAFTERYDLGPDVIEQSFVFDSLPRSGGLRLCIPVASDLDVVETEAGLEFRSDRGRIEYSHAGVVDATGKRPKGGSRIASGAITIEGGA